MKIDTRADAILVASHLLGESIKIEDLADALLKAHLEGIDQARSQFSLGKSYEEIRAQLDARRSFLISQIRSE